jgi:hypothetical protein
MQEPRNSGLLYAYAYITLSRRPTNGHWPDVFGDPGLISRPSLYKIAHFWPISAGQLHPFGLTGYLAFGRKRRHQLRRSCDRGSPSRKAS